MITWSSGSLYPWIFTKDSAFSRPHNRREIWDDRTLEAQLMGTGTLVQYIFATIMIQVPVYSTLSWSTKTWPTNVRRVRGFGEIIHYYYEMHSTYCTYYWRASPCPQWYSAHTYKKKNIYHRADNRFVHKIHRLKSSLQVFSRVLVSIDGYSVVSCVAWMARDQGSRDQGRDQGISWHHRSIPWRASFSR